MTLYYGTPRPPITSIVSWDGDNIDEVKDMFGEFYAPSFFVNEENNNLCFGPNLEDANQYPLGTLLTNLGGVSVVDSEYWDISYQTVDTPGRLKYTITEDAVPTVLSSRTKRS